MADDILDHGAPQIFNSAFTECAHIPLAHIMQHTETVGNIYSSGCMAYVKGISSSKCFPNESDQLGNMTRINIPSVNEKEDTTSGGTFEIQQKPCTTVKCQWLCGQIRCNSHSIAFQKCPMDWHCHASQNLIVYTQKPHTVPIHFIWVNLGMAMPWRTGMTTQTPSLYKSTSLWT